MAVVTMRQMLEAGVHFGHQTSRWNPKMKRFILSERNGIYIIDLQQSLAKIDAAYAFVRDTVAHGGTVLFVGTKRQAQEPIVEQASRVGMPYVNERWLGGMLTNFSTVSKRVARLKELEEIDYDDVAGSGYTKKELLGLRREKDKLEKSLGGIRAMARTPSVLWVVDTNKEHLAVEEASKLGIPVVGILDSNCDPDKISYGIPGNDDAIRAVHLLTRVIADAVAEGLVARHQARTEGGEDEGVVEEEPLAEWERELLGSGEAVDAEKAPADKAPAKKPAAKKPAAKKAATSDEAGEKQAASAEKAPAEKAPAKKPAAKKAATSDKPAAKKPAAKKPAKAE
jgi:small subunit ribosomal protein S2